MAGRRLRGKDAPVIPGRGGVVAAPSPISRFSRGHVFWTPPDPSLPCGIAFFGDIHWDGGTQASTFEADVEVLLSTPGLYCVLAGDLIDNHIKHENAKLQARSTPATQWNWVSEFLARVAPKTLAIVSGNHDAWTSYLTGFDPLAWMTRLLAVPYDQDEIAVHVQYPKVSYTIGVRHKYSGGSRLSPALKVKNWWRDGDLDWDIGVVAHDHVAVVEPFVRHQKLRWAVRPGTYQVDSAYARREGFHGSIPATPAVLLSPDRYRPEAVLHLDWAAEYLIGAGHRAAPATRGRRVRDRARDADRVQGRREARRPDRSRSQGGRRIKSRADRGSGKPGHPDRQLRQSDHGRQSRRVPA